MSVLSNMSPLKESSVQDASNTATPAKEAKIDATRFKTKLCRHYMESGVCPFQSRCVFSHGQVELRTSDENRTNGIVSEQSYTWADAPWTPSWSFASPTTLGSNHCPATLLSPQSQTPDDGVRKKKAPPGLDPRNVPTAERNTTGS